MVTMSTQGLASSFILPPSSLLALCVLILYSLPASAQRPVGWRTDGTGKYPNVNPPTEWSKSKNVVWSTKLPNWGNSSPVISKGRIFVCAEPSTLVCVNASDGKILWERTNTYEEALGPEAVAKWKENQKRADSIREQLTPTEQELVKVRRDLRAKPEDEDLKKKVEELSQKRNDLRAQINSLGGEQTPQTHPENGFSSPTPATDGNRVHALFGNGIVASYDFDGNRQWIQVVEKPTHGQGQSASPLLADGKLVVLVNSLTALDAATGAVVWKTSAQQRWGTPILAKAGETEVVVTPGGEIVRLGDGKALATGVGTLDYCAPIFEGDVAYFIQHNGKAVRLPAPNSDTLKPEPLWQTKPANDRYYASPILHDGLIYAVMQHGGFSVIDAANGEVIHTRKLDLGATIYSSVTLARDLLFISAENGRTVILQVGREPKEIARNELESFRCSPVFVGDRMFLKTREKLYCIGR
jgi:outer membrane protein assembly factor BamB